MGVYENLKDKNIIQDNPDGSISVNHYELDKQISEREQQYYNTLREEEHKSYITYNIIAISSFVLILIFTFIIAFKIGKKHKK